MPRTVATLSPAARERARSHECPPASDASMLFVGWEPPANDRLAAVDWERFEVDPAPTVTYRPSVTRDELAALLREPFAFVHYGAGVTDEGFVCSDGVLPFDALPEGAVGALSFQWHRPITPALDAIHEVASVGCLFDESLGLETAQELGVYLTVGRSVAASCRLTGVDAVRFHGDATRSVAQRAAGNPPFLALVEQVGDDAYHVTQRLTSDEHDRIGHIATVRHEKAPDNFQLAGSRMELSEPLSGAELAELLTHDLIFRFDSCPEGERQGTLSGVDDLLSK